MPSPTRSRHAMTDREGDIAGHHDYWSTNEVRSRSFSCWRGRWVPAILRELGAGRPRRHVLRTRVGPVSDKVLTATLRRLEAAGLVARTVVAGVPTEMDYSLTPLAETLWAPLAELARWKRGQGLT